MLQNVAEYKFYKVLAVFIACNCRPPSLFLVLQKSTVLNSELDPVL